MFNIYEKNKDNSARFLLGTKGIRNIYVLGLNPTTATDIKPDVTISKVMKVANNNGFDGFVMANLYPLRSTNPSDLPINKDEAISNENIKFIIEEVKKEIHPTIWCSWGVNIDSRSYFKDSLKKIHDELKLHNVNWKHFGELTKSGHPKHPSRLSYKWSFVDFPISEYLKN